MINCVFRDGVSCVETSVSICSILQKGQRVQIFVIPKIVKSREIANIQKVFELTAVLVEIFMFFVCENQIETHSQPKPGGNPEV